MQRLRIELRVAQRGRLYAMNPGITQDVKWWLRFLCVFNGVTYMWLLGVDTPDFIFATDACLSGCGGICGLSYFHRGFPDVGLPYLNHRDICHLEMWTLVAAVKLWATDLTGLKVTAFVDNKAVCDVVNGGKASDFFLQTVFRFCIAQVLAAHAASVLGRQQTCRLLESLGHFPRRASDLLF